MTPIQLTSLLVNSELRAHRAGPRGVAVMPARSAFGGSEATAEYSFLTHTYSMPVVREMPPRQVRSLPTW